MHAITGQKKPENVTQNITRIPLGINRIRLLQFYYSEKEVMNLILMLILVTVHLSSLYLKLYRDGLM
jgi:hypothetical protein